MTPPPSGPQRWKKLGLVFRPTGDKPWRLSHAATPTAEVLSGSRVRVYFTSRDANNRSHISSLELDVRKPSTVEALTIEPHVAPGPGGWFDADGTAMACVVRDASRRLLYYLGWQLATDVPWRNTIGLAIAERDTLKFKKVVGRLLDLNDVDPHSMSYPWVLREGGRWRMWYGSNLAWGKAEESMRHVIKYAESLDGEKWQRGGRIAIPLDEASGEFAVSRPCVLKDDAGYHMWYSRRTPAYRIGYAHSSDGLNWVRHDAVAGIAPTPGAWDGASVEYACVFDADGDRWMLYNGDDYGRAGFGLAVLEK